MEIVTDCSKTKTCMKPGSSHTSDSKTGTLVAPLAHWWLPWHTGGSLGTLVAPLANRLLGLVVKASTSGEEDPGFESRLRWDFSGSSHTSDFKIGTPVATLPGAWRYRVSAGTGRPGVSILWLGEVESLICNFYLSVAARTIVWADPSLRYTRILLGR